MSAIHLRDLKSLLISAKRSGRLVSFVVWDRDGHPTVYKQVHVLSVDARRNYVVVKLPVSLAIRRLRLFLFSEFETMSVYL